MLTEIYIKYKMSSIIFISIRTGAQSEHRIFSSTKKKEHSEHCSTFSMIYDK